MVVCLHRYTKVSFYGRRHIQKMKIEYQIDRMLMTAVFYKLFQVMFVGMCVTCHLIRTYLLSKLFTLDLNHSVYNSRLQFIEWQFFGSILTQIADHAFIGRIELANTSIPVIHQPNTDTYPSLTKTSLILFASGSHVTVTGIL